MLMVDQDIMANFQRNRDLINLLQNRGALCKKHVFHTQGSDGVVIARLIPLEWSGPLYVYQSHHHHSPCVPIRRLCPTGVYVRGFLNWRPTG